MAVQSHVPDAAAIRFCKKVEIKNRWGEDSKLIFISPYDENGDPILDYIIEITCGEAETRSEEGLKMVIGRYSWHNAGNTRPKKNNSTERPKKNNCTFSDSRGSDLLEFLTSEFKSSALWSEIRNAAQSTVLGKCINIYENLKLSEEKNDDPMMIFRLDVSPKNSKGYDKAEKLNTVTVFYKKLEYLPQLNTPLK